MNRVKKIFTAHKNAVIMAATIALIVVACSFAVYLRLYTGKELWYEMFAAIIGVIITAIITMMLLVGQTDSDERREKKGKVFEEKLRIYQEYLETLYNVIKAGRNTNDEKLKLAFKTSSVAMHCAPERVENISKSVKRVFKLAINENGNALETLSEAKWKELLNELFNVMDQFKADLYQNIKEGTISNWNDTLDTSPRPSAKTLMTRPCRRPWPSTLETTRKPLTSGQSLGNGKKRKSNGMPGAGRWKTIWQKEIALR